MARAPKSSQVITANGLLDGRVVFLTSAGDWVGMIDQAEVFADPSAAEVGMAVAVKSVAAGIVVEPYAIAVVTIDGRISPTLLRERIRAQGPTIFADVIA